MVSLRELNPFVDGFQRLVKRFIVVIKSVGKFIQVRPRYFDSDCHRCGMNTCDKH